MAQLQDTIEKLKGDLKVAQKEASAKVNDSQQFKNMKKILSSKNEQMKELRDRLSKYETVVVSQQHDE